MRLWSPPICLALTHSNMSFAASVSTGLTSPTRPSLPASYPATVTPRLATPRDIEDSRFTVNSTALEILNGYTKTQEDRKVTMGQPSRNKAAEKDKLRAGLFRYEMNGVLVYDSHARRVEDGDRNPLPVSSVPAHVRKELDATQDYDRLMYLNLPSFPPYKYIPSDSVLVSPLSNTLQFDSHFESGNLHKAIKITDDEYTLLQDYDIPTKGHTQWFYFSVRNSEYASPSVRFNIVNLMKYDSLYNNGMKPLVRSVRKEQATGVSWHRAGDSVTYYQNNIPRNVRLDSNLPQFHYTLSFVYTFEYEDDEVFFAHCYPYTYTDLQRYLQNVVIGNRDLVRVDELCQTIAGNQVPVLTVTNDVGTYTSWDEERVLMLKTAAGRKMHRQREDRRQAQLHSIAQIRGTSSPGRLHLGRKCASREERSDTDRPCPPR